MTNTQATGTLTIEALEQLAVGTKLRTNKGAILTLTHNSRHEHVDEQGRDRHTGHYYHGISLTTAEGKVVSFRTYALDGGNHTVDPMAARIVAQMEVA